MSYWAFFLTLAAFAAGLLLLIFLLYARMKQQATARHEQLKQLIAAQVPNATDKTEAFPAARAAKPTSLWIVTAKHADKRRVDIGGLTKEEITPTVKRLCSEGYYDLSATKQ